MFVGLLTIWAKIRIINHKVSYQSALSISFICYQKERIL